MLVENFIEHYPNPAHDLEVKVTNLEIYVRFAPNFLRSDRQAQVQASCPV